MDERTDIYAIGGLLFYLATGEYPDPDASPAMLGLRMWDRTIGRIVAACLEPEKEDRYLSVRQLMDDLEKLQKQPVSSLIIAVYGNEPGIGTTHISLGLSASLWEMKIANLYEECHPSPHLRRLGKSQGKRADSYGIFRLFGCALKPWYGRQVYFLTHRYPVVVQDRGVWRGGEGNKGNGRRGSKTRCRFAGGGRKVVECFTGAGFSISVAGIRSDYL